MSLFAIPYPVIDPVLVSIGPFNIHWYAIAYVVGIFGGISFIRYLNKASVPLKEAVIDDLLIWVTLGIILGGRLGYVVFYNLSYYLYHPLEIFSMWKGGMSFHGGMIGVIISMYFLARKHKVPFLNIMDLVATVAPLGICLGRLANFINGELYGRVTQVPWGMVFPNGGPLARHPSQLYEAFFEGFVLFILLVTLYISTRIAYKHGKISGIFLCGYSIARMAIEPFRQPDAHLGFILPHISMGQILSLPMLLLGLYLIFRKQPAHL